jgi:hypothetical protein
LPVSPLRRLVIRTPRLQRAVRWYASLPGAFPDWRGILRSDPQRWAQALAAAGSAGRVLIATSLGGHRGATTVEGLLAAALTLRGARVEALLCDRDLPACQLCEYVLLERPQRFAERGPGPICRRCFGPARAMYQRLGVPVHRYGELLEAAERVDLEAIAAGLTATQIPDFRLDGMALGEHALAGALRFYARGSLAEEPAGEAVLRRYFLAALIAAHAVRNLLRSGAYDCVLFSHGIYVPQGSVGEAARSLGVRVVNWNPGYRAGSFIFSHGDTYHHTLMSEPCESWESLPWGPALERRLLDYLDSRRHGGQDWIWFHHEPMEDYRQLARQLGIDTGRPLIGLLTNVVWDAQLHYPAKLFPGMLPWLLETVAYFNQRPELQLLIRVHPAEIHGGLQSRDRVADALRRRFGTLPDNVILVPPEHAASTYTLMESCDSVLIYGTKTGVELAARGIPVITAGEAWIRNKGISQNPTDRAAYFHLLDGLPAGRRLGPEAVQRARRYAYHFFFRRMIPLAAMQPTRRLGQPYEMRPVSLGDLAPGVDPGLDLICRGILEGEAFVFTDEVYAGA